MPLITQYSCSGKPQRPTANRPTQNLTQPEFKSNLNWALSPVPTDWNPEACLEITFHEDFNILYVHDFVMATIAHEVANSQSLELQLAQLATQLNNRYLHHNQRNSLTRQHRALGAQLQAIQRGDRLLSYRQDSLQLLETYERLARQGRTIMIGDTVNFSTERTSVVEAYLEIAQRYANISVIQHHNLQALCPTENCLTPFSEFIEDESYLWRCPQCSYTRDSLYREPVSHLESIGRGRSVYSDISNFEKAIRCFTGTQDVELPASLFAALDAHFAAIKFPSKEIIRTRPFEVATIDGVSTVLPYREGTSFALMLSALVATRHSKHYSDVNLIMYHYWDCRLPNIDHLIEPLMDMYARTQVVYDSIPAAEREREAALNKQFRLYVQLRTLGYPCRRIDFKLQTTEASLRNHARLWKIMCVRAGYGHQYREV